jgi:large subunit GTPase 1
METMLAFAEKHNCQPDPRFDNRIQFGTVGFPNVGKSSVINVLVGSSRHSHGAVRVAVASQPGKTKHFQTLLLPDQPDMMLCDCPGLVFPSFVSNTADLIAAGVYPIAQMRDHWPVIDLICQRIPREIIGAQYGIQLPVPSRQEMLERGLTDVPPPTAEEFLGTYCVARGMLAAASGVPDYQRAARLVTKDYAEGKLLYCHPPPGLDDVTSFYNETIVTALHNTEKLEEKLRRQQAHTEKKEHRKNDETNGDCPDPIDFVDNDLLELVGGSPSQMVQPNGRGKHGKNGKTPKQKWGKKDRKKRNKDPYGCHSNPDKVASGGVIMNSGRYSQAGYTRPTSYPVGR